jgi:hypothetical protein
LSRVGRFFFSKGELYVSESGAQHFDVALVDRLLLPLLRPVSCSVAYPSSQSVEQTLRLLTCLRRLSLRIQGAGLPPISGCTWLTQLSLRLTIDRSPENLPWTNCLLPSLRSLQVEAHLQPSGLDGALVGLSNLTELALPQPSAAVACLPQLRLLCCNWSIELYRLQLPAHLRLQIRRLPDVRLLQRPRPPAWFAQIESLSIEADVAGEAVGDIFASLPCLSSLQLMGSRLGWEVIPFLRQSLTQLVANVDYPLDRLGCLHSLELLAIVSSAQQGCDLRPLLSLTRLAVVEVSHTRLPITGAEHLLSGLSSLKTLNLGSDVKWGALSRGTSLLQQAAVPGWSDAQLVFGYCSSLRSLYIGGTSEPHQQTFLVQPHPSLVAVEIECDLQEAVWQQLCQRAGRYTEFNVSVWLSRERLAAWVVRNCWALVAHRKVALGLLCDWALCRRRGDRSSPLVNLQGELLCRILACLPWSELQLDEQTILRTLRRIQSRFGVS